MAERFNDLVKTYAALADPHRLAIVEELVVSDRAPSELRAALGIESNLLAHHLDALESAGLIDRIASLGDRRRRYVRLAVDTLDVLPTGTHAAARRVVFVCTENAARSQLAQGLWNQIHPLQAISGGTKPAERLQPGTLQTARRRGINLDNARPSPIPELEPDDLVITVCDRAHEHLRRRSDVRQIHWSIPDPAASPTPDAYDKAADDLARRIEVLIPRLSAEVNNDFEAHPGFHAGQARFGAGGPSAGRSPEL